MHSSRCNGEINVEVCLLVCLSPLNPQPYNYTIHILHNVLARSPISACPCSPISVVLLLSLISWPMLLPDTCLCPALGQWHGVRTHSTCLTCPLSSLYQTGPDLHAATGQIRSYLPNRINEHLTFTVTLK